VPEILVLLQNIAPVVSVTILHQLSQANFYDALGAGESIEFAYQLARNATQWTSTLSDVMPVLKPSG